MAWPENFNDRSQDLDNTMMLAKCTGVEKHL